MHVDRRLALNQPFGDHGGQHGQESEEGKEGKQKEKEVIVRRNLMGFG
jgi:hypothetical protein